jgi:hypothetical protein
VRPSILLSLSILAATSAAHLNAQTPLPAAPSPAPTLQTTPSLPAYGQQPAAPTSAPVPTPAAAPVVVPAQTTPQAPFAAAPAYQPFGVPDEDRIKEHYGSTYIPVDNWLYPALTRLYSLGFVDTMFLGMRPWTRQSVLHMIEDSSDAIRNSDSDEAKEIYAKVNRELALEFTNDGVNPRPAIYGAESVYTRVTGIAGQTLRDSYHLGQTFSNDYGRPYEPGFNSITGFSTVNEYGRFSLYLRGEIQHSPAGTGYSPALAQFLSHTYDAIDNNGFNANQATLPQPIVAGQNPFRLVEATLSFHIAGHEISGGKTDSWLGPAQGGALAWSNNAENIYSFRINRVEPLHIPLLSRVLGPIRYDFFYGNLKGHTAPNNPYTDSFMFSFRPSRNFEFGFQRTIIFGGEGHSPVTLHTFIKSFLSLSDTTTAEKYSRADPGSRFSDFNMSYRLPFVRKYVTFYVDSIAHDDVTPPSAPRRAAFRTGLYLSQVPGLRKLDFRVEAADTDPITGRSSGGSFNYFETIQRQGYTNKGFIMGDWIGREAKGGQAWLTYHLSGDELIQLEYLNKKNDKDFAPGSPSATAIDPFGVLSGFNALGGTTQNQGKLKVVKRLFHDQIELNGTIQYEKWSAPAYKTGPQSDTSTSIQITFFPGLKSHPTN